MKALILAAGKGTRLRPVTDKVIKPLLPLRGQPTLHYVISELLVLGITEIGIVVSPDNQAQINNFIEENRSLDENFIEIIVQEEQLGVAHAVASARSFIGNQNFVLYLGDNLFESGVDQVITEFNSNQIKHKSKVVLVNQTDFKYGTLRVRESCMIKLVENI